MKFSRGEEEGKKASLAIYFSTADTRHTKRKSA